MHIGCLIRASWPRSSGRVRGRVEALGDEVYETLARTGEAMTTAEMAAYALAQIEPSLL